MEGDMATEVVAILSVFGTMCFTVWVVFTSVRRWRTAQAQAQVQMRLLDRFGSSQELLAYMQTGDGKRFLDAAFIEHGNAFGRILTGIQAGIVFTIVGVAMLFLRNRMWDMGEGFLFLGTLLAAVGIGCLIAAGAAYLFSRSQGVLEQASSSRS
jgi:hypothetical protein